MARLPVIVGFGGFNAAGRSSFHQSYRRTVLESLDASQRQETLAGLAVMMQRVKAGDGGYTDHNNQSLSLADIESQLGQDIRDNTLIRPISESYFDTERVPSRQKVPLSKTEHGALQFDLPKRHLPQELPTHWQITDVDERYVRVNVAEEAEIAINSHYPSLVKSAGQLPDGFDPANLYASRFHPRALQLAIIGASDAINSMGIKWETVLQHVAPDQIGAYSSSVMSQLDGNGYGGLLQARLKGERVSTKQLALGMGSMTSDFVNAYVLGNLGSTGSIAGACASFLYNLRAGLDDIQSGRRRVVIVSGSEAPITPEIIDGYATMGALATFDKLCKLDGTDSPDLRRPSRPFGENCGFVIAESTQHVVLMDDELALALGASIHGAVSDVFVNGDGFKKSISAPGPGNYLTFAKAVASARSLLGDDALRQRSFVQAHGSSTPQNRTTESAILDRVASAFGISDWATTAVKSYLGHSLAPASGDQLINSLGIFAQGIFPGIKTIDKVADDVHQQRLSIDTQDRHLDTPMDVAFLNSKGFGGNNATASILSPAITEAMLSKRYGKEAMSQYQSRREKTEEQANDYHQQFLQGNYQVIYRFGQNMLDEQDVEIDEHKISVPGYGESIDLTKENLYKDMI
ncbi:MAG: beta-ketoacyl synthase [Cellvibrionaceae bacterium]